MKKINDDLKIDFEGNVAEELTDLIKKRSKVYSKALHEIKCDNLTKNEIVKNILETYEAR